MLSRVLSDFVNDVMVYGDFVYINIRCFSSENFMVVYFKCKVKETL